MQQFMPDLSNATAYESPSIRLVDSLLIHAELVRTGDSRLKEVADIIYDKYIDKL